MNAECAGINRHGRGRFRSIVDRYLPLPRILHPEPGVRFDAIHPR